MLTQSETTENDYELPLRHTCWIKVRDRVVYLVHRDNEVCIEIYGVDNETDSPLYETSFPFTTD